MAALHIVGDGVIPPGGAGIICQMYAAFRPVSLVDIAFRGGTARRQGEALKLHGITSVIVLLVVPPGGARGKTSREQHRSVKQISSFFIGMFLSCRCVIEGRRVYGGAYSYRYSATHDGAFVKPQRVRCLTRNHDFGMLVGKGADALWWMGTSFCPWRRPWSCCKF